MTRYELLERIDCPVHHSHNVWPLEDGRILVCDSMHGRLVDVASGEAAWECADAAAFTRGLACAGDFVYVGKSAQAVPAKRATSDGGVWVVDRRTWKLADFIPMPRAGTVHEVRVVDGCDECHHGRPLLELPSTDPGAAAEAVDLTAANIRQALRQRGTDVRGVVYCCAA